MSDITSATSDPSASGANTSKRRLGTRDGLFQRHGWWWLDYHDAEGRRHRKKAAPDYDTAKKMYRATMTAIARGEVLGVREEGLRLKEFVEKLYWRAVETSVSASERVRARSILDAQILPRFGSARLATLRREEIERWQADRLATVSGSTVNKELMRLGHLL